MISSVVGTGQKAFGGDGGPAAAAHFGGIYCIDFDRAGKRLYAIDLGNRRVRVVDLADRRGQHGGGQRRKGRPHRRSRRPAGPPGRPPGGGGRLAGAGLHRSSGTATPCGWWAPTARSARWPAPARRATRGDGGDARKALLNGPKHLTVDRDDSVLIVDTENHAIRRYSPGDGRITLVAGTGQRGGGGLGGPPEQLELARPHGVYVEKNGDLLLSDSENHRIVKSRSPTRDGVALR